MDEKIGRRSRFWLMPVVALALSLSGCIYPAPPPSAAYGPPAGSYAYADPGYYYPYYAYSPYYYPPAYAPAYGSVGFFFGGGGHRHFR